jgi:hypothetical protein
VSTSTTPAFSTTSSNGHHPDHNPIHPRFEASTIIPFYIFADIDRTVCTAQVETMNQLLAFCRLNHVAGLTRRDSAASD